MLKVGRQGRGSVLSFCVLSIRKQPLGRRLKLWVAAAAFMSLLHQLIQERDALIKEKADMQESDSQTRCRWTDCLNSLVGKSVIVKEHTNSSKTCISKQTITKTVDPTGPVSEPERQTLKYGTSLGLGTVLVHVFGLF